MKPLSDALFHTYERTTPSKQEGAVNKIMFIDDLVEYVMSPAKFFAHMANHYQASAEEMAKYAPAITCLRSHRTCLIKRELVTGEFHHIPFENERVDSVFDSDFIVGLATALFYVNRTRICTAKYLEGALDSGEIGRFEYKPNSNPGALANNYGVRKTQLFLLSEVNSLANERQEEIVETPGPRKTKRKGTADFSFLK